MSLSDTLNVTGCLILEHNCVLFGWSCVFLCFNAGHKGAALLPCTQKKEEKYDANMWSRVLRLCAALNP